MFGLDDRIAAFSDGATMVIVVLVAVLLGLRHASDPDHLAAVSTLVASGKERAARTAGRLGLAWGFGHATTLFVFGLPVVLYGAYLPEPVQSWAETSVGFVIVLLAVLLLSRWRRGAFRDGGVHTHRRARTSLQAYGVGLVHGMGGTAGVGLLLLATIQSRPLAILALGLFAAFTAVSMAALSTGWGAALGAAPVQRSFDRIAPAIGLTSLAFGVWYALGAQGVVPYVL
jgi:cytochrome c biogenesis protein CcdA